MKLIDNFTDVQIKNLSKNNVYFAILIPNYINTKVYNKY